MRSAVKQMLIDKTSPKLESRAVWGWWNEGPAQETEKDQKDQKLQLAVVSIVNAVGMGLLMWSWAKFL